MKIKPSKRAKKRYIAFEVVSNKLNNGYFAHNAIRKSVLNALGMQYGQAGVRFLNGKYRPSLHRGIFRVNNSHARAIIDAVNKTDSIKTLGMSGILKKAEERYLKITG